MIRWIGAVAMVTMTVFGASAAEWNSVAAGIDEGSNRSWVGVGYGEGATAEAARRAAMRKCRETGISSCKVIGAWNQGCVYVTTGTGKSGTGVVGWGSGETRREAHEKCIDNGKLETCKDPIGGCVDD